MSKSRILIPDRDERVCHNCRGWRGWDTLAIGREDSDVVDRQPLGQCRAALPTIDPSAIGNPNATWPVVAADDWCCLFQRAPD